MLTARGCPSLFQSTLPRGERRGMHGYHFECNVDFNPRSREGSDIGAEVTTKDLENFNPRSREGSDSCSARIPGRPFRFQSTLPRGERHRENGKKGGRPRFQSTLPRGERLQPPSDILPIPRFQSTLPRGERLRSAPKHLLMRKFQSTLPRGERRIFCQNDGQYQLFQSTLPRGERLLLPAIRRRCRNFNPRSREGSDPCNLDNPDSTPISIHAPARGATGLLPELW